MVPVLKNLMMLAQEHLLQVPLIERTIFIGMACALTGNLLMGTADWALLGGTLCAGGILAMFFGVAAYTLLDGLESQ